jgi:hypothetical protein
VADAPFEHPVRILFLDVDGTMTNGVIGFTKEGDYRSFWVRDGIALEWARSLGVLPVAISGRASLAVEARMHDLKLEHYLGARDKVAVAEKIRRARSAVGRVRDGGARRAQQARGLARWRTARPNCCPWSSTSPRRVPGSARCARWSR